MCGRAKTTPRPAARYSNAVPDMPAVAHPPQEPTTQPASPAAGKPAEPVARVRAHSPAWTARAARPPDSLAADHPSASCPQGPGPPGPGGARPGRPRTGNPPGPGLGQAAYHQPAQTIPGIGQPVLHPGHPSPPEPDPPAGPRALLTARFVIAAGVTPAASRHPLAVQHPQDDIKRPEHAGGSGLPRTERLDGPPQRLVLQAVPQRPPRLPCPGPTRAMMISSVTGTSRGLLAGPRCAWVRGPA